MATLVEEEVESLSRVEALKMKQALQSSMEKDLVLEEDSGKGAKELY